ncbi:uncharacterized protein LOC135689505 isoform X2 [Rhopilema esculentum]|uniref:uncharacterized protein LOC135689505 isoform X2 n=1 Tax=Rhopilema esculentum TaxID=499914 RepID=UPI0031DE1025
MLLRKLVSSKYLECVERASLNTLLSHEHPNILHVLEACEELFQGCEQFPRELCTFFRCISSNSPVCSYIPPTASFNHLAARLSSGLIIRKDPEALSELQICAPIVYGVIKCLPAASLPQPWITLLEELIVKSRYVTDFQPHDTSTSNSFLSNSLSFFPSWPQLSDRGSYTMDKTKSDTREECAKTYRGHPNLLPGIFTVYCQHEICYGFEMMQCQESTNVPFTIMRTKLPEAPEAIIYDNCCHLHHYCLNRDPGFFKQCNFLVDRFHWKNHKAYDRINTQINEQRNATLKTLKSQVSYMNEENFLSHIKLLLFHCNYTLKQEKGF